MEEIKQEKLENTGNLNGVDRSAFASWVVSMHRKLHSNRNKQVELAKKIGISRMTYYRIENDMTNHISFTTKSKIANVLNKNIEYVINLINLNKGE